MAQLITNEVARELRKVGNVTPLISVEGTQIVSDERRGRLNVLNQTLKDRELPAQSPSSPELQPAFVRAISRSW